MRITPTLIGVVIAGAAILILPYFTAPGYSVVKDSISELGAQNTPNAWIMNAGFITVGLGVIWDAIRRFPTSPIIGVSFIIFAVSMILVGVFSHQPIDADVPFDAREDELHSLFATVMGFAFCIGVIAQSFLEDSLWRRAFCYLAVIAAIALPLLMLAYPDIEGVPQRIMFLINFAWLAAFLPAISENSGRQP